MKNQYCPCFPNTTRWFPSLYCTCVLMKQQQVVKLTNPQSKKKAMSKTQKIYFVLVDNLFYHTSCCCPHRRSSRPGIKKNAVFVVNTFLYLIRVCGRIEKKKFVSKLVRKLE